MSDVRANAPTRLKTERWDGDYDLVVLGSGAAGLTAALVGCVEDLRVLLVEKTDYIGGTTAYSAGTCWIPNNAFLRLKGVLDDDVLAERYLDALVGSFAPRELRMAFLAAAPRMVSYLSERCDIRFRSYDSFVDYRTEIPGVRLGGRPLEPMPFDGRKLGSDFNKVRWPIPEWGLFGGRMSILRPEANRLLRIARLSPDAILLGSRLIARYLRDRFSYLRGTRLVLGNALVANLFHNILQLGGAVRLHARTIQLIAEQRGVLGILLQHEGRELRIRSRRGVVLAGGGFPANAEWRDRYLRQPAAQFTPACDGCVGETIMLGQRVGAALGPSREDNALWFPSSIGRRADGTTAIFPHIWDRAKPGLIAVNRAGKRFVDESVSYHEFTRAMYESNESVPTIPAMLICDRRFLWKYGLGMISPLTVFLRPYIASSYVVCAPTLRMLADRIGVDANGLEATVEANNRHAARGTDAEFNKGSSFYGRQYGDPGHLPNPCLGTIEKPPYFAVPVLPTPLATALGLRIDANGRVLNASGQPIPGLYACGSDAQSIMGGEYPGGGAQVASAMTFGYIAALHAVAKDDTAVPA
jgi:hypothetical protein